MCRWRFAFRVHLHSWNFIFFKGKGTQTQHTPGHSSSVAPLIINKTSIIEHPVQLKKIHMLHRTQLVQVLDRSESVRQKLLQYTTARKVMWCKPLSDVRAIRGIPNDNHLQSACVSVRRERRSEMIWPYSLEAKIWRLTLQLLNC